MERAMAPTAAYDEIADWYGNEFLGGQSTGARTWNGDPSMSTASCVIS
jgi:hypothetical protein